MPYICIFAYTTSTISNRHWCLTPHRVGCHKSCLAHRVRTQKYMGIELRAYRNCHTKSLYSSTGYSRSCATASCMYTLFCIVAHRSSYKLDNHDRVQSPTGLRAPLSSYTATSAYIPWYKRRRYGSCRIHFATNPKPVA